MLFDELIVNSVAISVVNSQFIYAMAYLFHVTQSPGFESLESKQYFCPGSSVFQLFEPLVEFPCLFQDIHLQMYSLGYIYASFMCKCGL